MQVTANYCVTAARWCQAAGSAAGGRTARAAHGGAQGDEGPDAEG